MIHRLLLCICLLGNAFLQGNCGNCTGRKILNGEEGLISDGQSKYMPSSDCEWLIEASGANKVISLTFEEMSTECSFDFLFIYDGKSYNSKLIATLSGDSEPSPVIAFSGFMLLHLFSDRNYQAQGFKARYKILDCPSDCSHRGKCEKHVCRCQPGYSGSGCEVVDCPNGCGKNGNCEFHSLNLQYCKCSTGYLGTDCGLELAEPDRRGRWYSVREGEGRELPARASHTSAYLDECIWVFGGFDLNSVLDDMWTFCMSTNQWENVENSAPWPEARSGHAMAVFQDGFYVFGGTLRNGSYSDELWYFNVTSLDWKQMEIAESHNYSLKVTGHTLTLVEDQLYLVGGKLEEQVFLDSIHTISAFQPVQWEEVIVKGGHYPPHRFVGHSTVFYKDTRSLLVFGGYTQLSAMVSERTRNIQAFNIDDSYWSHLYNKDWNSASVPRHRAYHSAVIMGTYLVVYGGNTHKHELLESCYNHEMFFYHLRCHIWVNHTHFTGQHFPRKGRFGHTAVVANGNLMFVIGGYSGKVMGDLLSYKSPVAVAEYQCPSKKTSCPATVTSNQSHCENYNHHTVCQDDPECIYCKKGRRDGSNRNCVHRNAVELCNNGSHHESIKRCPGICHALHTCKACVSQGKDGSVNMTSPTLHGLVQVKGCSWCVKEAQCQANSAPVGTCKAPNQTNSSIVGWWGGLSANLTSMQQCQQEDLPAGLIWVKYRDPMNTSFPDELSMTRYFHVEKALSKDANFISEFLGFIHPLNIFLPGGDLLMGLTNGKALLYLSRDETPQGKDLVVTISNATSHKMAKATRPDRSPIFPNISRGHKYYVEQKTIQSIPENATKNNSDRTIMTLAWTGAAKLFGGNKYFLTSEYLEPLSGGLCSASHNCMQCLTDVLCAWCEVTHSCVPRNTSVDVCRSGDKEEYLITTGDKCPTCGDYVQCTVCAHDPLCEWEISRGLCTRTGQNMIAVQNSTECPLSCQLRKNCSDCLMDKRRGECAWCKSTQTCLPFSDYVSRYVYGQCKSWLDGKETHDDCRTCENYATCDECLTEFGCGWCGNDYNPRLGLCVHGDFTGNYGSNNCSKLLSESHNLSVSESASWSYDQCPDVEECSLGLHKCHLNATCTNTQRSYLCECNRGFEGDGYHQCNETCYYECKQGICSDAPDYMCVCDLGWRDPSCDVNCGCYNHSTCNNGVGICDDCQHRTTGKSCEQCAVGTYGDPIDSAGCTPCICNGHGDISQGICNNTGQCFCIDNTYGDQCDLCKSGYYGDPRNGGKCYMMCDHRIYITNITEGALGSYQGYGVKGPKHLYCMWILSSLPSGHYPPYSSENQTIIALTIEGVDYECGQDGVYVYDGIPLPVKNDDQDSNKLLAVFCGRDFSMGYGNTIYARSGILTVYFEGDLDPMRPTQGFNASYTVYSCPDNCPGNQICQDAKCVCKDGFWGQGCTIPICPSKCHEKMQGQCHRNMCHCKPGFNGAACDYVDGENDLGLQLLTDSRLPQPSCSEETPAMSFPRSGVTKMEKEDEEDYGPCPRAGHSLTTCGNGLMFVFGGYSLEHGILNDMWMFNTSCNNWTRIIPSTPSSPGPRYHHAAACIPVLKTLYILGGFEDVDHQLHPKSSKSLWKFNIESHAWSYHDTLSGLPPMAGHTLTYAGGTNLIMIGGFSSANYFNDKVFEYNASVGMMAWRQYDSTDMNGAIPIGLYGHTAVYDPAAHTVYVYGGYLFQEKEWAISDKLFTYDLTDREWHIIYPQSPQLVEWEHRVFHAATHTDSGMVVIGGLTRTGKLALDVLVFRYECSTWHRIGFEDIELEEKTVSAHGLRAVSISNVVYAFGGLSGLAVGSLTKITLPRDICSLILDPDTCRNTSGCQTCTYASLTGNTVCYDSRLAHNSRPPGCDGQPSGEKRCDIRNHRLRPCRAYPTCSTCLATQPHFKAYPQRCHWCSNCKVCVSVQDTCPSQNCASEEFTIESVSHCPEHYCPASVCDRCSKFDNCVWSQKKPDYFGNSVVDWKCIIISHKVSNSDRGMSSSSNECPARCSEYRSCKGCLGSRGSEGGSRSCVWSEVLDECMAPAYIPLRCSLGECGYLHRHDAQSCPVGCKGLMKCADCIKSRACGWKARSGKNGEGKCLHGSMLGPTKAVYKEIYTKYSERGVPVPVVTGADTPLNEDWLWSYDKCQPENECQNGHHNCDPDTEECIDTLKHFSCQCKIGYYIKDKTSGKCEPVCHEGCVRGTCVRMDVCQCHFGWVGSNCSVECNCNRHSFCKGIHDTDNCTACQNNTKGPRCGYCKPLFVGNATDGGKCESCQIFCNHHTNICLESRLHERSLVKAMPIVCSLNDTSDKCRGPPKNSAVCLDCKHNTTGDRCQRCTSGHFRKRSELLTNPCQPCHCNGHSHICNAETGENCQCKNNTETNCDSKEELECWEHQCAHCKEYFLGKPTDGHQCYRQMIVDKDYCFDPGTQNNCNQYPQPLRLGQTVFFAVQPKYLNVDIRVTIDVTKGAADIFLSNKKDTFQVFLKNEIWHHDIFIDKMYTSSGATLARRSLQSDGRGHGLELNMPGGNHENITVNDEPTLSGFVDGEAIRITDSIPEYLRIHQSDKAFYKLSQFQNIKEAETLTESEPEKKEKIPWHKSHGDIDSGTDKVIEFLNAYEKHKTARNKSNNSKNQYNKNQHIKLRKHGARYKHLKRKHHKSASYGFHREKWPHPQDESYKGQQRLKRGVTVTDSRGDKKGIYNGHVKVGEINAGDLNTYITVNHHNSVLVVRNVRFRLVITLPRDQHDLKSSRFYIIVRSRGSKDNNSSFGNLYFRQDQPHIDLFVFFSVFFSCFFLFLALCVMFWKLRQSFDARRSRQMREREMECMASRPFAKILVLLESDGPSQPVVMTGPVHRRSMLTRMQNRNHYSTHNDMNALTVPLPMKDLGVVPIAIEPTDNGLAAVGTVLFQLPGGATTHSHLCLGSSLTTRMANLAPSQKVTNLRRRTSASSC